jgi:hypothetical protein
VRMIRDEVIAPLRQRMGHDARKKDTVAVQ